MFCFPGSVSYAIGCQGQPISHTTLTGYDGLNRVTSKSHTGVGSQQNLGWVYDTAAKGKGQLAVATAPNYHKMMTYDGLGRVKSESIKINNESTPKVFTYGYDQYSRLNQKTWPSGFAVKYGFNANGYAHTVKDAANDTVYWQATAMDVRGNVTGESFGNGVTTSKVFNITNGLAQSIQTGTAASPAAFQNLTYQWDTAGNLYQRTSAATGTGLGENYTEGFTYDNGHRLLTATTTGNISRTLAYGYDNLGNITSKTGVGTYTYGGAKPHAVTQTSDGTANTTYAYDDKGNMTQNGSRTLTYSVFNLPLTISEGTTNTIFRYGPEEQLIWQYTTQNNTGTYTSYYAGDYEEVQQGNTIRAKTSVNGIVVYSTVKKVGSQSESSDLSYLHTDHLGSTDSVTGRTAHLDTRMLFDPFGFRRQPSGADADPAYLATLAKTTFETTAKGYTGHEQIDSASLVHMGGRMYDPLLGRFLSPDDYVQFPEISQSYNRYSYVMNNPLSRVDPSGEQEESTNGEQPEGQEVNCKQNGTCQAKAANGDIGVNANKGTDKTKGSAGDENSQKKEDDKPESNLSRKQCVINGGGCNFEISGNPNADGSTPLYELDSMSQVSEHESAIDKASEETGVDPRLIRSIVYMETTHGYYDAPLSVVNANKSILPMNINVSYWGDAFGSRESLENPDNNIKAGALMLKSIKANLPADASVAKVGTIYNNVNATTVNNYGARISNVYEWQPWKNKDKK